MKGYTTAGVVLCGLLFWCQEEQTVADYLEENGYRMNRIAVELNGGILPKYEYSETRLKDGDSMEIVTFVGGG